MAGACVCALCGSSATAFYHKNQSKRTTVKNWKAWSTDCSRSLCSVFSLSPEKFLQPLTVGPYCLQCCTLIGDIHFTLRQVRTLEKRLGSLKVRLERQILTVHFDGGDRKLLEEDRFANSASDRGNLQTVVELLAQELRTQDRNELVKVKAEEAVESLTLIREEDLVPDFEIKERPPDTEPDEDWVPDSDSSNRPYTNEGSTSSASDSSGADLQPHARPRRRCARLGKRRRDNRKPSLAATPTSKTRKESKCNFCAATFRFRSHLEAHTIKEHPNNRLECKVCKACYRSEESLEAHVKNMHGGVFPLRCPVCQHGFHNVEELDYHKLVHESSNPFTCSTCQQICTNSADLEAHIREHVNQFRCDRPGCEKKTFITQTLLNRHMKAHDKPKNHSCDTCGMGFRAKILLDHHSSSHSTDRRFKCGQCAAAFKSLRSLQSHTSRHSGNHRNQPHPCRICKKSFSSNANRLRHEEIHAGTKSYVCSKCGKTFTTKNNLRSHNYSAHHPSGIIRVKEWREIAKARREKKKNSKIQKELAYASSESESKISQISKGSHGFGSKIGPQECKVCAAQLLGIKSLRIHMTTEHPDFRFECTACPAKYRSDINLDAHIKNMHGGLYPFFCLICRLGFNSSEELAAHQPIHSGPNPFTCPTCQKTFIDSSCLERHIRSHRNLLHCPHPGCEELFATIATLSRHNLNAHKLNAFMCEICGANSRSRAGLLQHMAKHGPRKSFTCHLCSSKFTQSGNLKQHLKRHLEKTSYPCTVCGRSFSFNDNRLRHEQIHARATFPCNHCTKTFTTKNCLWAHENGVHKGGYRKQGELEKLKKRAKTLEGKTKVNTDTGERASSNSPNNEAGTGELPCQAS